jgi:RNA polymerase sigma factor (sigma-70 family)
LLPIGVLLFGKQIYFEYNLHMRSETVETYILLNQRSKEGIKLLYERYGRKLYSYAISSWKLNEDDAWDLIYKTLYKTLESYKNYLFNNEEKFASYVFKIFINFLKNHHRDEKRKKEKLELVELNIDPKTNEEEEEYTKDSEIMSQLKSELEKLEEWERMLLLLRSQDMPYAEIAKFIYKPEDHLKVYYQRLKEKLQGNMNIIKQNKQIA